MVPRIEDYALIGDCTTAALVGRDGSIDWLCWPRFDAGACFTRILGTPDNGRWLLGPSTPAAKATRSYRDRTLTLETRIETEDGLAVIQDFMPTGLAGSHIVRLVRGIKGTVRLRTQLIIRVDYGAVVPWVRRPDDGALHAVAGPDRVVLRTPIHEDVCAKGFDPKLGTFTQSYGSNEIDASLLLIALVGFLPPEDKRVRSTVEANERDLMQDGFVLRYRSETVADGLPFGDGAFLACSFWLADNLILLRRREDAVALFERLLSVCNDLGLLAEEYDVASQSLTGNFPQAFSHIALVSTAYNLARSAKPVEQRSGHPRRTEHSHKKTQINQRLSSFPNAHGCAYFHNLHGKS